MKKYYLVCHEDGSITLVPREGDLNQQIHASLGGYYDHVRLPGDYIALVHDEGLLNGMKMNRLFAEQGLCGPVVIVREVDVPREGNGVRYIEKDMDGMNVDLALILAGHIADMPILPEEEAESCRPQPPYTKFYPMDSKQWDEYVETGKLPEEGESL